MRSLAWEEEGVNRKFGSKSPSAMTGTDCAGSSLGVKASPR